MKTKKILSFVTVVLMLFAFSMSANAEPVKVGKASTFIYCLKKNLDMQLVADIDLSSFNDEVSNYTGEISGLNENAKKEGDIVYFSLKNCKYMLADKMTGAYIHNIGLVDCKVKWHMYVNTDGQALLCLNAKNCRFEEITMFNIQIEGARDSYVDALSEYTHGACLVSRDNGSTFKGIIAQNCRAYVEDMYAGIFASTATNSTFINCMTNAGCAVYSGGIIDDGSATSDSDCGGFCGYAEGCTFTDCSNTASVSGKNDRVGGIVGRGKNCKFDHCNNAGTILQNEISSIKGLAATVPASSLLAGVAGTYGGLNSIFGIIHSMTASRPIILDKPTEAALKANPGLKQAWDNAEVLEEANGTYLRTYNSLYAQFSTMMTYVSIVMAIYDITQMIYNANESDELGGIAGYLEGSTVSCCSNFGWCACPDAYCGGILGKGTSSTVIDNCLNQGVVQGVEQTGCIVGSMDGGTVKTCLNMGTLRCKTESSCDMICGETKNATFTGNFISHDTFEIRDGEQYNYATQEDIASGELTRMLNMYSDSDVWRQTVGTDPSPTLSSSSQLITESNYTQYVNYDIDPTISTNDASVFMSAIVNPYSKIKLTGDIDLNTNRFMLSSKLMPFRGSIDGQGHKITNIAYTLTRVGKGQHEDYQDDVALFPYATNATFKDLELSNFNIYPGGLDGTYIAMLVAHSNNCTYDNVKLTGKSTFVTDGDKNFLGSGIIDFLDMIWDYGEVTHSSIIGGLAAESVNDTFNRCSTSDRCYLLTSGSTFYSACIGGLVGTSDGSKFIHCVNEATVIADDDKVGGIVGEAKNSVLYGCVNGGTIKGDDMIAGLAGFAKATDIILGVNVGEVKCVSMVYNDCNVGGIVGKTESGSGHVVDYCYNFGDISKGSNTGCIIGENNGADIKNCGYCCKKGSDQTTNMTTEQTQGLVTGAFTYNFNNEESGEVDGYAKIYESTPTTAQVMFQSLDNNSYFTKYPVPIFEAGHVNQNIQCDHDEQYSNKYSWEFYSHEPDFNKFGICQTCGRANTLESYSPTIDNADDMRDFAYAVSKGVDFGTVTITTDIDLSGETWCPMGSVNCPFTGTLEGGSHRIKNMNIDKVDGQVGLFCALGNGATIQNLVIDSTCVVRSSATGVGAFAGCAQTENGSECVVQFINCGNEATVSGYENVGGFIGGLYSNDNAVLKISNSYNIGTIKGYTDAAAFCGYARLKPELSNSWNGGLVGNINDNQAFVFPSNGTYTNCYDINTNSASAITKITSADVASGKLCYLLNGSVDGSNASGWYQRIGIDEHPVYSNNPISTAAVYNHSYYFCDDAETLIGYYTNTAACDSTSTVHTFDDNGICHRVSGTLHFMEPKLVDNVWQIGNAGNLYWVGINYSGESTNDCILTNDIVMNDSVMVNDTLYASKVGSFIPWTPIGKDKDEFVNVFNGNGHTISGIYLNDNDFVCAGLIGSAKNATICNVGIKDSYINCNAEGAFIAGQAESTTIRNCYSTGSVSANVYVGGIAGFIDNAAKLQNCYTLAYTNCTSTVSNKESMQKLSGALIGYTVAGTPANCFYLPSHTNGTYVCGTEKSVLSFSTGEVCSLLNKNTTDGDCAWQQAIDNVAAPMFGNDGITYSRAVSSYYGTLVLPFAIESNDSVKLFTIDNIDADNKLHLKAATSVDANTPCFFKVTTECNNFTITAPEGDITLETVPKIACDNNGTSLNLVGTYTTQTIEPSTTSTDYYIALDQLWLGEAQFTVPAYRAFIQIPQYSSSKSASCLYIVDPEDQATVIGEISQGSITFYNDRIYNLSGQRISTPQRDKVNIINGKKVFLK